HLAHALDARQAIRRLADLILETRIVDRLRRGAENGYRTGERRGVELLIQDRGGPGRLRVGGDEATALDRLGRLRCKQPTSDDEHDEPDAQNHPAPAHHGGAETCKGIVHTFLRPRARSPRTIDAVL